MKTLAVAQMDFRLNDHDGNGVQDFWRGDVAGLNGLLPPCGTEPIRLIDTFVALADTRPMAAYPLGSWGPGPYNGYWFKALRHVGDSPPSPDRFAACAYPVRYRYRMRWTYIVSEDNVIYRKKLNPPGRLEIYPADPIADGWTPLP